MAHATVTQEFGDIFPPGYADECLAFEGFRADFDEIVAAYQSQVAVAPPSLRPLRTVATLLLLDLRLALLIVRNGRLWWRSRRRTQRTRASLRSIGIMSDQIAW